jgi:hypothetical protein
MSHPVKTLSRLQKTHSGLKVVSENDSLRLCFPIAADSIVFENSTETAQRSAGELSEIIEEVFGGKFVLPVRVSASGLEASFSRVAQPEDTKKPLATLEIWSLEPGSYDLVLRLSPEAAQNEEFINHTASGFIDRAQEVSRLIDNLDLLRFQAGPGLSLTNARKHLNTLERQSGTRLTSETLLMLLGQSVRQIS